MDNKYNLTVFRQKSDDLPKGKSPSITIKFVKDDFQKEIRPDFIIVLKELYRTINNKDKKSIFARPVTETQAPNYFNIIKKGMDLQTMYERINNHFYSNILLMLEDAVIMCQNALIYNTAETIYYKLALQILNHLRRAFSKDALKKFSDNIISRELIDDEIGDVTKCIRYVTSLQFQASKLRPGKSLPREIQSHFENYKTKPFICPTICDPESGISSRRRSITKIEECKTASSSIYISDDDDDVDEDDDVEFLSKDCENSSFNKETDSILSSEESCAYIIESSIAASNVAREKLKRKYEKIGQEQKILCLTDDVPGNNMKSLHLADQNDGNIYKIEGKAESRFRNLSSINIGLALMEGINTPFKIDQLCYGPNENIATTTSRPLHLYSNAEQAVFVETFGDVATAEYACNMHNFVRGLPKNSLAVKSVKNRLNACTNYLAFGVDQIIIKKLRNIPKN